MVKYLVLTRGNALHARLSGRLQSAGGAPKGVLREGVAPALWADAVPFGALRGAVRVATTERGAQRRIVMAKVNVMWELQ